MDLVLEIILKYAFLLFSKVAFSQAFFPVCLELGNEDFNFGIRWSRKTTILYRLQVGEVVTTIPSKCWYD